MFEPKANYGTNPITLKYIVKWALKDPECISTPYKLARLVAVTLCDRHPCTVFSKTGECNDCQIDWDDRTESLEYRISEVMMSPLFYSGRE